MCHINRELLRCQGAATSVCVCVWGGGGAHACDTVCVCSTVPLSKLYACQAC